MKHSGEAPCFTNMTSLNELTVEQLRKAVEIKEQIEMLQGEIEALTGGGVESLAPQNPKRQGPRKMSRAARAAIAKAQKARWAKVKAGKSEEAEPKKKRKMSDAGRARIAAAAKARWAKFRAEKK
jgi:hypothetical protein